MYFLVRNDGLYKKIEPKIKDHFKNASVGMSKDYKTKVDIQLGGIVPLDVFIDEKNAVSIMNLMNISNENLVGSTNVLLVKNKLLYVYVYSIYESNKDIDFVRNISANFVYSILKDNS